MDDREFLQAVVPWDSGGYITIHWHRSGWNKMPGRSCRTIDEAFIVINECKDRYDVYFCLSSQRINSGHRSRDNAISLKAVWVDIDVDPNNPNKYPSIEVAIASLLQFCQLVGIPFPSGIMLSGGGLHAYWFSDRSLSVNEWQVFADLLKAAAKASTVKIDAAVTSDAARLLRPPGTKNHKYGDPIPVRLLQPYCNGKEHDFSVIFKQLSGQFPAEPRRDNVIHMADAFKHLDPNQKLAEGVEVREAPPVPFEAIKAECGWLRHVHETHGADQDEPLWHDALRALVFVKDGHGLIHEISKGHPTYTHEKTEEKYDQALQYKLKNNLGWPQCHTIHGHGATQCLSCPHFPRNKSPINIGHVVAKEEEIDQEILELGGRRPPEMRLPKGYALDLQDRLVAFFPPKEVKGKIVQAAFFFVLIHSKLGAPALQHKDGGFGLAFTTSTDKGNDSEVFYKLPDIRDITKSLLAQNVRVSMDKGADDMLKKFALSWLDKLMLEDVAVRDPGTMGWRYNKDGHRCGFMYGNKLYNEDGSITTVNTAANDDFRSWYRPVGKAEVWERTAKLITDRKRPELDCILAVAFAAPLTVFSGTLYGAILSVWGESGTAKSTAQAVAAAVWGHPKQTRESLNSTPKSVQGRLGRTRNLPAYWDDVQDERHQAALFDCMFVTSEGAEGGRLNPDASYKQRLEWQTLMVACSNASFVDFLLKKQKSTTAGIRRVFEIEFNRAPGDVGWINPLQASQTFAGLEHNYGVVGEAYARLLAGRHKEIAILVTDTINNFTHRVKGTNDESFWWGICGVILAGATLANRMKVVNFDLLALEEYLVKAFLANRQARRTEGTEGGTFEHTYQALSGFLNHFAGSGNILFVDRMYSNRHTKVAVFADPSTGRPIYIQVARDARKVIVSKAAFRKWLHKEEINTRSVFSGMHKFFDAQESKITIGAGTKHGVAQELCFEFEIPKDSDLLEAIIQAWGASQKP